MEKYTLDKDIPLICVAAKSFPDGVQAAFDELQTKLKDGNRKLFGISHPGNDGNIIYKAAAEELHDGEAAELSCEHFVVKKGVFISETVTGLPERMSQIAPTFQKLLKTPGIDPKGYCVEMYLNESDVQCMVGLLDQ